MLSQARARAAAAAAVAARRRRTRRGPDWQPACDSTAAATSKRPDGRRPGRPGAGVPRGGPRSETIASSSSLEPPVVRHLDASPGTPVPPPIACPTGRGRSHRAEPGPSRGLAGRELQDRGLGHRCRGRPGAGGSGGRFASGRSRVSTQNAGNRSPTRRARGSPPARRPRRPGGTRAAPRRDRCDPTGEVPRGRAAGVRGPGDDLGT